jgi:hypothetical protein
MSLQVPVAFIIFNRPDTTARVFAEIARARPSKLIVIADGPRTNVPGEAERCARTRAVIEAVDWDCEVLTDFSDRNLGCRARVSSGLDFVFDQVEEAIILEDDCLPHPSFFSFCESLLERYRHNEEVMVISGNNLHGGRKYTPFSYFFSHFVHIWGWASWRRAWKHYDVNMRQWSELRNTSWLEDKLGNVKDAYYWSTVLDKISAGKLDTWDCQWLFSCWLHNGLTIIPKVNLVSNIGFGENATHTTDLDDAVANVPLAAMQFPMSHPPDIVANHAADEFESQHVFRSRGTSLYTRSRNKLAAITPSYIREVLSRVGIASQSKDAK